MADMVGWLLVPHEALHVLAHRLIDRPYVYQLGDRAVYSPQHETMSLVEKLFVLALPALVIEGTAVLLLVLWATTVTSVMPASHLYLSAGPLWHKGLAVLAVVLGTYAGTSGRDLRMCRGLLRARKRRIAQVNPPA